MAAERLASEGLGPGVRVEDLCYAAVAVAQLLEELRPDALVLVGADERGGVAGRVRCRAVTPGGIPPADARLAVADAVTGYVSIDLVVTVASALGFLPAATIVVEVEPDSTQPSTELSPAASRGLEEALGIVRGEVQGLLTAG